MADETENIENADLGSQERETQSFTFSMASEEVEQEQIQQEQDVIIPDETKQVETDVQKEIVADAPADSKQVEEEYVELDENLALEFIAKSKGMTVDEFNESLTPKEQKKYAPEIVAFNEFYEKTGNKNYNDFLETQKDWDSETPENTLKEYIRLSNPDLSVKERERLYDKKYSIEDLDEEDDEDLILDRTIDTKEDLRKAKEFFAKRKEEFSVASGTDEHIPTEYREAKRIIEESKKQEEENSIVYQQARKEFLSKTDARFNEDFKGFEVELGSEATGFQKVLFKPENIKETKDFLSDIGNFENTFYDEKGNLKDQEGLQEAVYFAKNYKSELNKAYLRGMADKVEADDKLSKNIQPDNPTSAPTQSQTGYTFSVE